MEASSNQERIRVGIEISNAGYCGVRLDGQNQIEGARRVAIAPDQAPGEQLFEFIAALKREFGEFSRAGVAVPGLVDRSLNRVTFSAHIPEHSDIDLAGYIKNGTGVDAVLENDANAAAYGEFSLGAGRESRNIFYATLGEGIGGAFIFDGKIWRGASGFAGEFGFVTINSEGARLEEFASSANIIRRTRSRFHQDSTSSLRRLGEESINIEAIVAAAVNGDSFSQMMLERTGMYVGSALASVINLLNVETVVIGGEIMKAGQIVLDAIIDRARELSFQPSFESTAIVAGELSDNAAAAGAAILAADSAI